MIKMILTGATATGKSKFAYFLARLNGCEIISADSRQIYREMNIGTGQVDKSWRQEIPHHFMGFLSPLKSYSVFRFRKEVMEFVARNDNKDFIVVGGTGLYIKSLLYRQQEERAPIPTSIRDKVKNDIHIYGTKHVHSQLSAIDPASAKKIHPNDGFRVAKAYEHYLMTGESYQKLSALKEIHPDFVDVPLLCLERPRAEIYDRINKRVCEMVEQGWVKEVRRMLNNYDKKSLPCLNALGYRQMVEHCSGFCDLNTTISKIQQLTRKFAKKQITFFKTQLPSSIHVEDKVLFSLGEKSHWRLKPLLKSIFDQI